MPELQSKAGTRPRRFLGYGRQSINENDVAAVSKVLRSDFLTQGPTVSAFEADIAAYAGARFAVAVSSGTAALHVACLAGGMKPGDIGVTQPLTFVASANCIAYCGGQPRLVDVDPDTLTMSPANLETFLAANPNCQAVIPVAFGGLAVDGEALQKIAGDRIVIEDNSHAFGGEQADGRKVGSCTHADMAVLSFHPVKPLTTAEGGAVTTNDEGLYERLLAFRSHGIVRGPGKVENEAEAESPWYYEQQLLGYNYRLTDIQAALGQSQLPRLDRFIARRREVAALYDELFADFDRLSLVQNTKDERARSAHHLYLVRIDFDKLGKSRKLVMNELRAAGVGTQVHYIPVHQQPYYRERLPANERAFAVTDNYYRECLSLPCFVDLTDDEVEYVAATLRAALS